MPLGALLMTAEWRSELWRHLYEHRRHFYDRRDDHNMFKAQATECKLWRRKVYTIGYSSKNTW
jgi:hypothetical protein